MTRPIESIETVACQLDVIAADVADVISSVGGWLYDQARTGWQVKVFVVDAGDVRPLQILGLTTAPFESVFTTTPSRTQPASIAVGAQILTRNTHVREHIDRALELSIGDVTLWGDACPAKLAHRTHPVEHRLSADARAFKRQALLAAQIPQPQVADTEIFRSHLQPTALSEITPRIRRAVLKEVR